MGKQFVFLNFHTEYSSEGTLEKPMRREYCFGDVFYHDPKQNNTYKIVVYRSLYGVNNGAKNNACFMSKQELFDYISIAKRIHDFELTIEDACNYKKFIIELSLDAPRVIHRYILSWLRYAYEFPFNMYLSDAIKLKNVTGFKRDDLFNLFNLVGASVGYHFHGDRIHAIGDVCSVRKFYTPKEQIEIVQRANNSSQVNDLFDEINVNVKTLIENVEDFRDKFESLEYWQDNDEFKSRVKFYKKNKKLIKAYKD